MPFYKNTSYLNKLFLIFQILPFFLYFNFITCQTLSFVFKHFYQPLSVIYLMFCMLFMNEKFCPSCRKMFFHLNTRQVRDALPSLFCWINVQTKIKLLIIHIFLQQKLLFFDLIYFSEFSFLPPPPEIVIYYTFMLCCIISCGLCLIFHSLNILTLCLISPFEIVVLLLLLI